MLIMHSARMMGNSGSGISQCSIFLAFSALLSFWTLICNVEFGLNSSCLDLLSNFGIDSLQKLQNLPQNAISIIIGTLMCKLG